MNCRIVRTGALVAAAALVLAGCSSAPTAPTGGSGPSTLQTVRIFNSVALEVGGPNVQFRAEGAYADGSARDLTSQVTWSSSNQAMATISAGGLATAHAPGTVTVEAAFQGQTGNATLLVLGRLWQVTLTVQRVECLEDCENVTQGQGDFTYGVDLLLPLTQAFLAGVQPPDLVRMGTGEVHRIDVTRQFEVRDQPGQFVHLSFKATEWDTNLVGITSADDRMAGRLSIARYDFAANETWLGDGGFITIGQSGCRLRLHYTISKEP